MQFINWLLETGSKRVSIPYIPSVNTPNCKAEKKKKARYQNWFLSL